MVPSTQVPEPPQFTPAHCPHFAIVPAGAGALEVVVTTTDFVEVDRVVGLAVDNDDEVADGAEDELTTTPPGPATEVVRDPLSI